MADEQQPLSNRAKRKKLKKQDVIQHKEAKQWLKEWGDALLFAGIAALLIRQFIFGAFRIPTPSMEKTLLVGDFLIVSKINYGPRTPMSIAFPFTDWHIPHLTLPWFRIPGFDTIKRNDVVVFNYPMDEKVISQKEHYIKRLVGMPGDTLKLVAKQLYVNGEVATQIGIKEYQFEVFVGEKLRLSEARVREAGGEMVGMSSSNSYVINMTEELSQQMGKWPGVDSLRKYTFPETYREQGRNQFVFASGVEGNRDYFPERVVPFKGQEITLTEQNWTYYYDIIARYEGNSFKRSGNQFVINGETTHSYTIKQNYYFMMGDNRDNSLDSRYWGYVPEDHIVGEASFIYFSFDKDSFFPRFGRILNIIR